MVLSWLGQGSRSARVQDAIEKAGVSHDESNGQTQAISGKDLRVVKLVSQLSFQGKILQGSNDGGMEVWGCPRPQLGDSSQVVTRRRCHLVSAGLRSICGLEELQVNQRGREG